MPGASVIPEPPGTMVGTGVAVGAIIGALAGAFVGMGFTVGLAASTVVVPATRTASSTSRISPVKMLLILITYHPLHI
jgi:hypothetical protein